MTSHVFHAPRLLAGATFLGLVFLGTPSFARDADRAKALFDEGMHEMPEGNYEKACPAFAESLRLDPLPGTAFTLAVCESRAGKVATAQKRFEDFLQLVETLPPKDRKKQADRVAVAKEQIGKLEQVIPKLTLRLPPDAPANLSIKRNGDLVTPKEMGHALPLDPGEYVLTTEIPGLPLRKKRILLAKGESKTVIVDVPSAETDVDEGMATHSMPTRKKVGLALGAVGLTALVTGGITTGVAFGEKNKLQTHCGTNIGESNPKVCDQIGVDAAQTIGALNVTSTVGFAVGGVALGVGVILLATSPASQPSPVETGRHNVRLGFAVDPSNVAVHLQGVW